jgi:hypothetical protein
MRSQIYKGRLIILRPFKPKILKLFRPRRGLAKFLVASGEIADNFRINYYAPGKQFNNTVCVPYQCINGLISVHIDSNQCSYARAIVGLTT